MGKEQKQKEQQSSSQKMVNTKKTGSPFNERNRINKTKLLSKEHIKKDFDCGNKLLNDYIQKTASQDVKRQMSACFVMPDEQDNVLGYFTLSNTSISYKDFDESIRKKFNPSYDSIPTTLLGRLAVSTAHKGKKIGEYLLLDAIKRAYDISNTSGSFAVIVDPINDDAMRFYEKYGFIKLSDSGKMMLAMSSIKILIDG